ncbi:MAG TPA: glycoside hydrolase family 28 protein [Verrucomicrobiae bacterium]|nr:glycoside hydrolase family 28 protein [Verrucomicrobiae bacterium]
MNRNSVKMAWSNILAVAALAGLMVGCKTTGQNESAHGAYSVTTPSQTEPARGSFNVTTFGASSDGQTMCTEAIHKAIDAAASRGGGTVFFPSGTYLTGPIHLQSHITLYLDAGATIKFSTNFDDYLPMVPSRWEGISVTNFSPLISAFQASDVAIVGRGTLDGQGKAWWDFLHNLRGNKDAPRSKWQDEFARLNQDRITELNYGPLNVGFLRPPFIQMWECTNVLVDGVTIRNSPFWNVTPVYCENVTVHGVSIISPAKSPNTDGINPDSCRNVHISDCLLDVGDDCITIKSGRDADGRRIGKPAENYVIDNCTLLHGHGLSIGSEMSGGVRNIAIANCIFENTDNGIRIKSTRGRGGVIEDVRISNLVMRNIRDDVLVLTTFYRKSDPEPVSERTPIFRNIHFNGITGSGKVTCEVTGLAEMPVEDVTFSDIQLTGKTGFAIKDAKGIELHHVTVNTESGPAFTATGTDGLELDGVTTAKPHEGTPVVQLGEVKNVFVHGCVATPGTETFLRMNESSADDVTVDGNDLKQAKTAVEKVSATATPAPKDGQQ